MKGPIPPESIVSAKVHTLAQLRWAATAGQLTTILFVTSVMHLNFDLRPLLGMVALESGVSALCQLLRGRGFHFQSGHLRALLLFDVFALTVLLHFAGSVENPFNFLYLVHIVLAAMLLGARDAWALSAVSSVFHLESRTCDR